MSPCSQLRAIDIVQRPDTEAAEEDAQTDSDHGPHCPQDFSVSLVFSSFFNLLGFGHHWALLSLLVFLMPLAIVRSDVQLHYRQAPKENDSSQDRVSNLVEGWVFEVMVVSSNEERERGTEYPEQELDRLRTAVRECCPEH